MKRLMILSVVIIVILLSFNSIGCQQKTEPATAPPLELTPTPKPTFTPKPTQTSEPTPTPIETGSTCDNKLLSYNIPLSFRKSGELMTPWEPPELEDASSEPQLWCFYHTPEALPTMRNYFKNQGLGVGWSKVEGKGFDEVEESLSYWTRDANPDGAMVWMKPKEPGTFIAIAIYTRQ